MQWYGSPPCRLVKGGEIKAGCANFEMAVLSKLPWFKLRESYPLSGEPVTMRRRDMRRGGCNAGAYLSFLFEFFRLSKAANSAGSPSP